jgi:hypothetical protein
LEVRTQNHGRQDSANRDLHNPMNRRAQTSQVFRDLGSLFSRGLGTDQVLSFNYAML